jgi:hypothetical protein
MKPGASPGSNRNTRRQRDDVRRRHYAKQAAKAGVDVLAGLGNDQDESQPWAYRLKVPSTMAAIPDSSAALAPAARQSQDSPPIELIEQCNFPYLKPSWVRMPGSFSDRVLQRARQQSSSIIDRFRDRSLHLPLAIYYSRSQFRKERDPRPGCCAANGVKCHVSCDMAVAELKGLIRLLKKHMNLLRLRARACDCVRRPSPVKVEL